jgi:hypothetical protein
MLLKFKFPKGSVTMAIVACSSKGVSQETKRRLGFGWFGAEKEALASDSINTCDGPFC